MIKVSIFDAMGTLPRLLFDKKVGTSLRSAKDFSMRGTSYMAESITLKITALIITVIAGIPILAKRKMKPLPFRGTRS